MPTGFKKTLDDWTRRLHGDEAEALGHSTLHDLITSVRQMALINARDTGDRLEVLFNPQKLSMEIETSRGTLNPIGSSHPVKQYAHTAELQFSLELYMTSSAAILRHFSTDLNRAINWLASFVYPEGRQLAPPPLIVVWPNTVGKVVTVDHINVEYLRWHADGKPRIVTVTLDVSELRAREKPIYAHKSRKHGFIDSAVSGAYYGPLGGTPGKAPKLTTGTRKRVDLSAPGGRVTQVLRGQ
jgi:hypothetical protein